MYKLFYQSGTYLVSARSLSDILHTALKLADVELPRSNYFYPGALASISLRLESSGLTVECFNGVWFIITYHEGESEDDDMDRSGPRIEVKE